MRFPLMNLFTSTYLNLIEMKKMPAHCSDHFAMCVSLQHEEGLPAKRKNPPTKEQKEQAMEKATA